MTNQDMLGNNAQEYLAEINGNSTQVVEFLSADNGTVQYADGTAATVITSTSDFGTNTAEFTEYTTLPGSNQIFTTTNYTSTPQIFTDTISTSTPHIFSDSISIMPDAPTQMLTDDQ